MFRSCKVSSTSLFNKWESHKDKMRKNQGQRTHKKTCPQSHSNTTYTFFRNDCLASLYAKVYKVSIQTNTNVKMRYFQDCSDIFVKLTNGISGDNLLPCFESHEFLHSMNSFFIKCKFFSRCKHDEQFTLSLFSYDSSWNDCELCKQQLSWRLHKTCCCIWIVL